MTIRCDFLMLLAYLLLSIAAASQTTANLETSDTKLQLEAGTNAPRLIALQSGDWRNRATESPIPTVEIDGRSIQLDWTFNPVASHVDKKLVSFVYDTVSPRLRLTWEWEVRSEHGPIEHQIRIENRDSTELWLPLEPSFVFDWQEALQDQLQHFYVEKPTYLRFPKGMNGRERRVVTRNPVPERRGRSFPIFSLSAPTGHNQDGMSA